MSKVDTNKKGYVLVGKNSNIGRIIGYFGILAIICIISFLIAKYIIRSRIDRNDIPIDTSERL